MVDPTREEIEAAKEIQRLEGVSKKEAMELAQRGMVAVEAEAPPKEYGTPAPPHTTPPPPPPVVEPPDEVAPPVEGSWKPMGRTRDDPEAVKAWTDQVDEVVATQIAKDVEREVIEADVARKRVEAILPFTEEPPSKEFLAAERRVERLGRVKRERWGETIEEGEVREYMEWYRGEYDPAYSAYEREFMLRYKMSPERYAEKAAQAAPLITKYEQEAAEAGRAYERYQTYLGPAAVRPGEVGVGGEPTQAYYQRVYKTLGGVAEEARPKFPFSVPATILGREETYPEKLYYGAEAQIGARPPAFATEMYTAVSRAESVRGPAQTAFGHIGARAFGALEEGWQFGERLLGGRPGRGRPVSPISGIFAPTEAEMGTHPARRFITGAAAGAIVYPLEVKAFSKGISITGRVARRGVMAVGRAPLKAYARFAPPAVKARLYGESTRISRFAGTAPPTKVVSIVEPTKKVVAFTEPEMAVMQTTTTGGRFTQRITGLFARSKRVFAEQTYMRGARTRVPAAQPTLAEGEQIFVGVRGGVGTWIRKGQRMASDARGLFVRTVKGGKVTERLGLRGVTDAEKLKWRQISGAKEVGGTIDITAGQRIMRYPPPPKEMGVAVDPGPSAPGLNVFTRPTVAPPSPYVTSVVRPTYYLDVAPLQIGGAMSALSPAFILGAGATPRVETAQVQVVKQRKRVRQVAGAQPKFGIGAFGVTGAGVGLGAVASVGAAQRSGVAQAQAVGQAQAFKQVAVAKMRMRLPKSPFLADVRRGRRPTVPKAGKFKRVYRERFFPAEITIGDGRMWEKPKKKKVTRKRRRKK